MNAKKTALIGDSAQACRSAPKKKGIVPLRSTASKKIHTIRQVPLCSYELVRLDKRRYSSIYLHFEESCFEQGSVDCGDAFHFSAVNSWRTTSKVCSAVRFRHGHAFFIRTGSSKKLRAKVKWNPSSQSPWLGKGWMAAQ